MQLFHSSTGLIDLSARPAHPICCGGTLLFALVCFASCGYVQLSLPLVGKLHPYLFRCILNASMHFDIFIFAGHLRLGAFCEAHLTSGGLNFSESWT